MKHRTAGVVAALIALAASAPGVRAQRPADVPNPFAIFDSFRLPNGLKVWYGHLPGATMTSMAIVVPAGWDQDPPGREQSAHLLEHVLLSDRAGRTEAELVRELTLRGGSHNGVTAPDRTYYPVHISSDQAAYGLQWLHDVIAPRPITSALVESHREPVAIEIGAGPRSWLDRLAHTFLVHPSLRPAGFWLREFGLSTAQDRHHDPYTSLTSITAADLTAYHDRYYTTSEMLLVVVSGVPRPILQPVMDSTFGLLPWRPAPDRPQAGPLRSRASERYSWTFDNSTRLRLMYRVADLNHRDHLRLIFVEDMLRHRLMERLRRGADKSVYSIHATTEIRGPAAYLAVIARIDPAQESIARAIIDEELQRLGAASRDTAAFYADRDALGHRLRVQNAAPGALVAWATERFYPPDLHAEFPDLGEYYATVGPDSIAAFVQRLAVPENRILHLTRATPLPSLVLVGVLGLAAAAAIVLFRRIHLRPADMSRIRYVARLRRPLLLSLAGRALALAVVLVIARAAVMAAELAAEYWIFTIDSPLLHLGLLAGTTFAVAFVAITAAGHVPRKVLVFDDEVRIKSMTYRASIRRAQDITNIWTSRPGAAIQPVGPAQLPRPEPPLRPLHRLRMAASGTVILGLEDGSLDILAVANPDLLATSLLAMKDSPRCAETAVAIPS